MILTTNLRKMSTSLDEGAKYILNVVNIVDYEGTYFMNPLVGEEICIRYEGDIHCIESGKKIRKTFGEGMSYDAWLKSPLSAPSIVRPELSRIHEGIALRDAAWEEEYHNKPHYVYLSLTSGVKVGVTRVQNKISRWIDQGAVQGIVVAETPYRQLAGLMEVELKNHLADKTAWQAMLRYRFTGEISLVEFKERMLSALPSEFEAFFCDNDEVTTIDYPVIAYPEKLKSLKLDTTPHYRGKLTGIKGQYLVFEDGTVFNVRAHAGYRVTIEA
jgi:hypothetical protein